MIASRLDIPDSSDHLAKSINRIAFLATIPINRITPIMLIKLSVAPVTSRPSTTPISDSGSAIRIASGSRNDPNCTTSTKYISITATPNAIRMRPNTSC